MKNFTLFLALLFVIAVSMAAASPEPSQWFESEATLMKRDLVYADNNTAVALTKRTNAEITYYGGEDLKHSACYGRSGLPNYNAKPTDMIAAMYMRGLEMCYKCLEIRNGKVSTKSIIVKVIDKCAGCPRKAQNVDLTLGAFKQIAKPIDGRVKIQWRGLPSCPKKGSWPTLEIRKKKRKN